MQQRVGIARALALDPSVLLMDEPFGALDAITREKLQRDIADILARQPKTTLFITHNMDEAIFFSDRILVFGTRPGRIIEEVMVPFARPRTVDSYDLVFKPENAKKFADCGIAMLDSPTDILEITLNYLGKDPHSAKKADIDAAERPCWRSGPTSTSSTPRATSTIWSMASCAW